MSNIELLREFIKEIFLESNKPPSWMKTGMEVKYFPNKDDSKLKNKAKKKVKVKIIEPDGPSDRSIVSYRNKEYSVKTHSLKKK